METLESRIHLSRGAATGIEHAAAFLSAAQSPAISAQAFAPNLARAAAAPAVVLSPATDLSHSVTGSVSDGHLSLPYRFFVPQRATATQKVPLILYLHGLGDGGTDDVSQTFWMSNLQANTASGPYAAYILAPQIPAGAVWAVDGKNPTEIESLTMSLINEILPFNSHIDPTRIYITGVSAGSQGVWDLLQRNPKFFAAGVPMSAGINPNVAPRLKGIPIWAFHGGADTVVSPQSTRAMITAMIAAGGTPWYTEIGGAGHAIWDQAYAKPSLYAWMFAQHGGRAGK